MSVIVTRLCHATVSYNVVVSVSQHGGSDEGGEGFLTVSQTKHEAADNVMKQLRVIRADEQTSTTSHLHVIPTNCQQTP